MGFPIHSYQSTIGTKVQQNSLHISSHLLCSHCLAASLTEALFPAKECDPRVVQTARDTDVEPAEVGQAKAIVCEEEHTHVRGEHVLEAADDGSCERRVERRA